MEMETVFLVAAIVLGAAAVGLALWERRRRQTPDDNYTPRHRGVYDQSRDLPDENRSWD